MNFRSIVTLTALSLTPFAGFSVHAEEYAATLEWQTPGYVMDVVVATAPRPAAVTSVIADITPADVPLARNEPGYVEEVIVVRANRAEVLARARAAALEAALARRQLTAGRFGNVMGAPAH